MKRTLRPSAHASHPITPTGKKPSDRGPGPCSKATSANSRNLAKDSLDTFDWDCTYSVTVCVPNASMLCKARLIRAQPLPIRLSIFDQSSEAAGTNRPANRRSSQYRQATNGRQTFAKHREALPMKSKLLAIFCFLAVSLFVVE